MGHPGPEVYLFLRKAKAPAGRPNGRPDFKADSRRWIADRFPMATPSIGIIMGSTSDWATLEHAAQTLDGLGIAYEKRVVSAHRTPELMVEYAKTAESRGLKVIIAGAGGAAHLPGMTASLTPLPVLGVPVESHTLKGVDSLLSIVQMPGGVPVATFAIGKAGAINAALFAAAILAQGDQAIKGALDRFRAAQTSKVLEAKLP
jgi:5-(carboxyamino)imidazole ribonucleotide mutase